MDLFPNYFFCSISFGRIDQRGAVCDALPKRFNSALVSPCAHSHCGQKDVCVRQPLVFHVMSDRGPPRALSQMHAVSSPLARAAPSSLGTAAGFLTKSISSQWECE